MGGIGIFEESIIYLIVINIIAFVVFYIDKKKAEKGKWRISETTLFTLAAGFGSIGAILGMIVFRHKTKKLRFVIGLPVILVIQVVGVLVFMLL